jgi:hypothetical protein
MSVRPTKTRLALLREVANGSVFRDAIGDDYISGDRKITARIGELLAGGWVELDDRTSPARGNGLRYWVLTDVGSAVLNVNGGTR